VKEQKGAKQRARRAQVLDIDIGDIRPIAKDVVIVEMEDEDETLDDSPDDYEADPPPVADLSALLDRRRSRQAVLSYTKGMNCRQRKLNITDDARLAGDFMTLC
jgi:hypothetical protein